MNTEKIEQLLEKYFEGETTLNEEKELREFFQQDEIPAHLKSYIDQFSYIHALGTPGADIDPMAKIEMAEAKESPIQEIRSSSSGEFKRMSPTIIWTLRAAAAIILVLTGLTTGLLINQQQGASDEQLATLQSEINQVKKALMYGPVQQASASERISAVHMSTQLPQSNHLDKEITEILIHTMNNDRNVNVRLAATEALFRFRDEPEIGKALTNSLPHQTNPIMQITLIDMLVEMKQKSAINEMQKMLLRAETQEIVKVRLENSIAELKA
tara:strand:+ start:13305 stop:14114 length:810 start_codon:yes stop_codon:yes gene_type:complete